MRRLAAVTAALLLALWIPAPVGADDYALTPDSLTAGPVTFTESYPKAAARQAHHSQFHSNPYTQVYCAGQGFVTNVDTKSAISGGFQATTYALDLPAGDCSAVLLYWVDDQTGVHPVTVAFAYFTVAQ